MRESHAWIAGWSDEGVALARYHAYLAKAHVLWDLRRVESGDAVFRNTT
jgi:hypothetical protein